MAIDGPLAIGGFAAAAGRAGVAGGLLELMRRSLCVMRAGMGNDRLFMRTVTAVAFVGKPRARRSWRWYLRGAGRPLHIDTQALWASDHGFAACCGRAIAQALDHGETTGRVWVDQRRLARRDWRYALGSFWVEWWLQGDGKVMLRVRGRYDWAPHQPRVTRPLHAAAEGLKHAGARAFDLEGEAICVNVLDIREAGTLKLVTHRALI